MQRKNFKPVRDRAVFNFKCCMELTAYGVELFHKLWKTSNKLK